MTRNEILTRKRYPCWLVGLMLVGSGFAGVACEGSVRGEHEETENGGNGGGEDGGVDADVDVDTDEQGGEGENE